MRHGHELRNPDSRGTLYRDALRELGERYGSGIRALEALPAHVDADADTVLALLAQAFRMTPIGIREMHGLEPDFSVMPFVEATARLCMGFRDGAGLLFVIADPLDARIRWLHRPAHARAPHRAVPVVARERRRSECLSCRPRKGCAGDGHARDGRRRAGRQ